MENKIQKDKMQKNGGDNNSSGHKFAWTQTENYNATIKWFSISALDLEKERKNL